MIVPNPRKLQASLIKSESESYVKAYPVSMAKQEKRVQDEYKLIQSREDTLRSNKGFQPEPEPRWQAIEKSFEPITIRKQTEPRPRAQSNLVSKSEASGKAELREEFPKRSNMIYRDNLMKDEHRDYKYSPIQVQQRGNMPYISKTNLSYNPSARTLNNDFSKKSICEMAR